MTKYPFDSFLFSVMFLKVLYLIFTIVLVFWACFLPFWIWQLLIQSYPSLPLSSKVKRNINYLTTCLTFSNSCINPFLYTLLTKNYKEYLRKHKRSWTAGSYFNKRSRFQRSPRRSPSASSQQCTESFMLTHTASLRAHNSSLWGRSSFFFLECAKYVFFSFQHQFLSTIRPFALKIVYILYFFHLLSCQCVPWCLFAICNRNSEAG